MTTTLTRRLLREWKILMRGSSHTTECNHYFHLKPQDNNLHVWHLVITEPNTGTEVYIVLYIADNNNDPNNLVIFMRCLTPNDFCPMNKNISLNHLSLILRNHGFNGLIMKIWHTFFDSIDSDSNVCNNSRVLRAWNRIMYKDFKLHFPEIVGTLQTGDYQIVKGLARNLSSSNNRNTLNIDECSQMSPRNKNMNFLVCDDDLSCTFENSSIVKRQRHFLSSIINNENMAVEVDRPRKKMKH